VEQKILQMVKLVVAAAEQVLLQMRVPELLLKDMMAVKVAEALVHPVVTLAVAAVELVL
tara:strand:- start:497 stop:673 length:177 start_codon:yes stop_codon:yes gene_type:complete